MPIVEGIYKRGMLVDELKTNGFYINQAVLESMKEIGCDLLIKISFDGIAPPDAVRLR